MLWTSAEPNRSRGGGIDMKAMAEKTAMKFDFWDLNDKRLQKK
jgi:hypothetical protein